MVLIWRLCHVSHVSQDDMTDILMKCPTLTYCETGYMKFLGLYKWHVYFAEVSSIQVFTQSTYVIIIDCAYFLCLTFSFNPLQPPRVSNKSSSFSSEDTSLQKTVVSSAYWESFSTPKTSSNPDKRKSCLTPRCNSNQFDA